MGERTFWIPDGRDLFGQWESRLLGDDTVHEAADLVPAYTSRADIGWVVTHRRDADGQVEPYVFTHFYRIDLPLRDGIDGQRQVVLPDDPALVILAACVVKPPPAIWAASELVDRPAYPSVTIEAERRAFVDTVTVAITSPNRGVQIEVQLDGASPVEYTGAPLVLTDTTALTVTARGRFPEPLVRTATFTRLVPWPAVDAGATAAGLATRSYTGAWNALPDWSQLEPTQRSTSVTVTIPDGLPAEDIGIVHTGFIEAPTRGVYRFWLTSDDGSRLWIGDELVVDHDGLHGSSAVWGDAPLDAGRHPIMVEFFQHLGGIDLELEWSGPGFPRREVPASALSH